ncbi:hypothetical protein ASE00_08510 [Sphingomonas sp. Root710]|uniref:hypothetical protein n=1 Tax=Sphingomonas sp. Root710 TaxID=1736594 RepID=UPI0006FDD536|nr:hypothetical protein [Sphingomonas sp. Root710]KRB86711.1 hypothetical protein ASE00_08510 [Sphingomonas sp. Root710]
MYLPVPSQPDCASAWREAVRLVDALPGHAAYNVIIDVANAVTGTRTDDPRVAAVDAFLRPYEKTVETVANTIFPSQFYYRYGAPAFFEAFTSRVLAKVRKNCRWSGYYFERMISVPRADGPPINQLWEIVSRMKAPSVKANNKFELSLFDPDRDVDESPYGGQCLSFLSFKLLPGDPKTLTLTAMYRNHYYVEKLLGNLIGLGRLMEFVAHEAGLKVGSLTVISTHAVVDQPKSKAKGQATRAQIEAMIAAFDQASAKPALAA